MRITGGKARGIPLRVPRGESVRPATDALRQAVFSSLGSRVVGSTFLDLFAGSGAYGLEALSRGASGGAFVDHDSRAAACVRQNLTAVGRSLARDTSAIAVIEAEVASVLNQGALSPETDLVFIDPPYEAIGSVSADLFASLGRLLSAGRDPLVLFVMPGEVDLQPPGWTLMKRIGRARVRQPTACFFRPVQM
jgi:16S rRNA (guanine966-N2)-methyltransferase